MKSSLISPPYLLVCLSLSFLLLSSFFHFISHLVSSQMGLKTPTASLFPNITLMQIRRQKLSRKQCPSVYTCRHQRQTERHTDNTCLCPVVHAYPETQWTIEITRNKLKEAHSSCAKTLIWTDKQTWQWHSLMWWNITKLNSLMIPNPYLLQHLGFEVWRHQISFTQWLLQLLHLAEQRGELSP